MNQNKKLVGQTFKIGNLTLKNRMAVAPLTRMRGDIRTGVPSDLMKEYYTQRSGYGLIITECSQISSLSNSFPGSGGIYTEKQKQGWKKIVDSVHQKGGKIFLQIWHCGRQVKSENIEGQQPIGPSAIAAKGRYNYPVPKEMTQDDIDRVKIKFRQGAINAKDAGFDGVELHGANGYLVDQFLKDYSNKRNDKYGGSIENRSRFLFEVLDELIEVFGSQRVAVRLSPTGRFGDMYDSDPISLMKYVLKELEKKDLAFVELKRHGNLEKQDVAEGATVDELGRTLPQYQAPDFFNTFRPFYNGVIMANDGFDPVSAQQILDDGDADLVSFGTLSMANPDLPERVSNGWEINRKVDFSKAFSSGPEGYIDYPLYRKD